MADLVTVTIDDKPVQVPAGTLVVDAARAAGIEIPIFCSHPKLDPLGACRMCLVEFVGPRGSRLDTACTVRVADAMVVRTDTPQVKAVREANLGFILVNHPLDCPICDKGGECPLQDQTMAFGPGVSRSVEPKQHKRKKYPISELIMLDQERCILCWRCIRYLEEWEDKPQLGLFERGGETAIDTFPGMPVDAKTSGNIIDICPVGALTNRVARFRYRPWELRRTPSICTQCAVGCNIRLDERVHQLRRVVARENAAVNDEWICDKGRFLHQFVDQPERLAQPLVRENGQLRPATWDEALSRVVDGLGAVVDSLGANAVGGIASARIGNEAAYLFQKFFRAVVGTNNVDYREGSAVQAWPAGLSSIAGIAASDLIVLVGLDPSEAAPVLDLHIKRAVRRAGAKLLIINPRRIELARYPGSYIAVLPGNEAAALNQIVSTLQAGKSANQPSPKPATQPAGRADPALGQSVVRRDERAPSGRPQAEWAKAAADLLQNARTPLFLYGPDAATGERGRAAVAALSVLANVLGQGDRLAYVGSDANSQGLRDMGLLSDALPGQQPVGDTAVRERLGKLWGQQPPAEPGVSYERMLAGGVRALFVVGEDPAEAPECAEALRQLEFLVVQDLFLTETGQLANVVLPACSFAEADGTYTNLERRVQRAPQAIRAAGESRPDWAILAALADRWLASQGSSDSVPAEVAGATGQPAWKKKRRKIRQGSAPKPWNYPNSQAVLEEVTRAVPAYANLRWESLGESGLQWQPSAPARAGRRPETPEAEPVALPVPGSYWLVGERLLWDGGVLMKYAADEVRALIPPPFVALNPGDATAAGLAEGSKVSVSSAHGTVSLVLRADASVQPGTAWVPGGQTGLPSQTLGAGRGDPVSVRLALI